MDSCLIIVLDNHDVLAGVCGANDENLRALEDALDCRIAVRGNELSLNSENEGVRARFKSVLDTLIASVSRGDSLSTDFVRAVVDGSGEEGGYGAGSREDPFKEAAILIPRGYGRVLPRSLNQARYIIGMRSTDIVFCAGPAGTGKTYLAVAEALREVLSKKRRKLVLTRPVVEAGESLGFLPGDLAQKINPYLRPLYDAMEALVPFETIRRMEESGLIEIAPLAYMRGRSLNDCVVILDEAQNTTKEQMKMFLTRIGEGSKAIVTGDATQVDLPKRSESGLLHALRVLSGVPGLHFSYLNTADVVRNPLIKHIIEAYEREKD
ncbi:MAG TPA: phosphate starvation-inducible protein PhoH [Treponema sp.]|nr:MAG: phosphate starvation-inducible protein PhoH [Treponema sp. GWA1_62_8]OHE66990.1 MAG: phosphate starvation-inducible protein PhoH [Treponema sp. GWC1_61_84]OHE74992.1 MAG: phosphate starvation-inducible protein PhoH [Treponema sp. RIFOXYC1_FULL_61_9]HCM25455.1 phosphate starvation-inducible protein PhoH [Treponema sp.]